MEGNLPGTAHEEPWLIHGPRSETLGSERRVAELVLQAFSHHQSNRLSEAEWIYREVLSINPHHTDALHLLGVIAYQTNRNLEAVNLIDRAITLNKEVPVFHSSMASALRSLGRKVDAIAHLRHAITLKPDYFEALWALAYSLREIRKLDEAAAIYLWVLMIRPEDPVAHNNLGEVLGDQGKIKEATAHFEKAVAKKPDFAEAHFNLGNTFLAQDKIQEAVAHYQQAIKIQPQMVEAFNNLANALLRIGRADDAVGCYREALAIRPDYAEALNNLGNAMRVWHGVVDQAIACYRQALVIKPDFADAFNNLGNALREKGLLTEARAACERAIDLSPGTGMFQHSLAILKRFSPGDQQLATMKKMAAKGHYLSSKDQIYLNFALAKAYEDIGEVDSSFRHLHQANLRKRQVITYDEAGVFAGFDRIKQVFSCELLKAKHGFGVSSSAPTFIVGMPRSGTSLVEQILASHPNVFGAGELRYFGSDVARACGPTMYPEWVFNTGPKELEELGATYVAQVEQLAPNVTHITDKMPGNFRFLGLIYLALPNARVIHVRRDPLDTCFSCFSKLFEGNQPYSYDLGELGRYYGAYEALMGHWRNVLPPGFMLEVKYEDIIGDLEGEARRLIAHCELDWYPGCIEFEATLRPVRTASALQVRQPIYRTSIGRWRPYLNFLESLVNALNSSGVPPFASRPG